MKKMFKNVPFWVICILIAVITLATRARAQEVGQFIYITAITCDTEEDVHAMLDRLTDKMTVSEAIQHFDGLTCTYGKHSTFFVGMKPKYTNKLGDTFFIGEFVTEDKHLFGWQLAISGTSL